MRGILILLCIFLISGAMLSSNTGICTTPGEVYTGDITLSYRNITVYAPAVAQTSNGYIGVISTITVTIQDHGSGQVFVDTTPLTQIDMQGSARLAVNVASALIKNDKNSSDISPSSYDYFFVVRTSSPIIGGPSAGAVMTVATVALLKNWSISSTTIMTGMINPDGSIGPIGGIPQKIDAAYSVGATRFLIPKGQMSYTEMVTETITSGGIIQITTRPVVRNVSDYARSKYGIEVVEVEDINDALRYMTGYEFLNPASESNITTDQYIRAMQPLASSLLNQARTAYQNASNALNNSYIPNYFPMYYRNQINNIFNNAKNTLDDATRWYEEGMYYSSTSKSFQSLINSNLVSYACEYFNTDNDQKYIEKLLDKAKELYEDRSEEAKKARIQGVITLQCVGAAQERVSEAHSYLSDAESSFNNHDYLNALYKIAYAIQRSESASWWLRISDYYNDTGEFNSTTLNNLAEEYITDAQQAITYSEVILEEMGQTSSYLSEAKTVLESAENDYEAGYPASALFQAFQAIAKGNLALELVDGAAFDKVERARERASASISESRRQGIEPVLAVSYYEYAESLANESSYDDALVYYKYSDLISGALRFTSGSGRMTSSRYIGIPEIPPVSQLYNVKSLYPILLVLFGVGVTTGLALGVILGGVLHERNPHSKEETSWIPRSIEDYYRKNK
ncbi:MAG: S16 family serine protease [Candidatus Thermoplasmatota archaeon]